MLFFQSTFWVGAEIRQKKIVNIFPSYWIGFFMIEKYCQFVRLISPLLFYIRHIFTSRNFCSPFIILNITSNLNDHRVLIAT